MTDKNLQRVVTKAVADVRQGKKLKLHVAISGVGWVSGHVAAPPAELDEHTYLCLTGGKNSNSWDSERMVVPLAAVVAWAEEGGDWSLW